LNPGRAVRAILPGFLERPIREWVVARRDAKALRDHRRSPGASPPHAAKVEAVLACARRHGIRRLVETGTFEGEMARKVRGAFDSIVTIELSPALAREARRKLRPYSRITVLEGDSAVVLPRVLLELRGPALFWLDGHYSGGATARGERDTPLLEELRTIAAHGVREHVVLIDDARLLGTGDYPSRERVEQILGAGMWGYRLTIEDDIARWEPEPSAPGSSSGRQAVNQGAVPASGS
jgi:hypothetical protein